MERDFLGLNTMKPIAATVKREISDEESHRPFMKKVSSFPHLVSTKAGAGQEDEMNKTQNFSLSLSNSIMKPGFVGFGQNVPKAVSPPMGQVVGFTEPWNSSKSSAAAPQLTIFYGGTVSVYEGLSPEKVQAIMLLAGNGSFLGSNKNSPSPQAQSPLTTAEGFPNQLSVLSHASKDKHLMAKTAEISSAPVSKPEDQRVVVPPRGPASMPAMTPSAVPQFRKASLARFLEKRKERVMNSGPYTCEKKQPDGVIPGNDNMGSATPSAANSGTSPVAAARRS